ncbi:MAG: archease [bacterium]
MSTSHYEFLEHTADVVIRGYGSDLDEAFAAAGRALFHLITDSAEIVGRRSWSWELAADDYEGLLVGFLTELIARFDADFELSSDLQVRLDGSTGLKVTGKSIVYDDSRHGSGTAVKGVSYHMMEIRNATDGQQAYVQVLLDI